MLVSLVFFVLQCGLERRFGLLFYSLVGCGVVFLEERNQEDVMNKIKQLIELVSGLFQRKEKSVTKQNVTVIGNNVIIIVKSDKQ